VFTGAKRMGTERAEENGGIYLSVQFISMSFILNSDLGPDP